MSANDKQVSGSHYKTSMECWDYIIANDLDYLTGNAVKYLTRWRKKNGIEDLRKAEHYIQKLIEVELASPSAGHVERRVNLRPLQDSVASSSSTARPDFADTVPVWPGELNNLTITRPDNG